ncbi:hypothetical protein EVAR_69263_1 [Eumeta japonica]|uniref:Uncharacterized protein n=1 Tax=Eumeta variegata TaxID=151549 RepID=A0A4C1SB71_EUMVA|nr:hypothetical protein EVAR_69263_1 [Eumeta japonica]
MARRSAVVRPVLIGGDGGADGQERQLASLGRLSSARDVTSTRPPRRRLPLLAARPPRIDQPVRSGCRSPNVYKQLPVAGIHRVFTAPSGSRIPLDDDRHRRRRRRTARHAVRTRIRTPGVD